MVMNLLGIPTDLPLYDQQGNLIPQDFQPSDLMEFESQERESTPEEKEQSDKLLTIVKDKLAEVDDVGADLTVSDLVNVYEYSEDSEYYTVTIFGGKNGSGLWSNYLTVLADLLHRLEAEFDDVWIRKFNIDTSDDVFDAEIAVVTFKGQID